MISLKVKTGAQIILIPTEDILPPENYTRIVTSAEEINRLSESLINNGILNPLTVRSRNDGKYIVVSGERRRIAAKQAGFQYLPCILIAADELQSIIYDLTESIHCRQLHFLECAQAIDRLHGIFTVNEISEMLNIPEGAILSRIRLLSLPENIKWKIISSDLNENIANSLCGIKDIIKLNKVTDLIISSGLSFNEALKIVEGEVSKSVFIAHYKDLKVFENTVEHAIDTMNASGIKAQTVKNENNTHIVYTVTINKVI